MGVPRYRGKFGAREAERLLWRAGFGPRPGEARKLSQINLRFRPGTRYVLYCSLKHHRAKGMVAHISRQRLTRRSFSARRTVSLPDFALRTM